jgi:Flp pilus assembly protein CpaB
MTQQRRLLVVAIVLAVAALAMALRSPARSTEFSGPRVPVVLSPAELAAGSRIDEEVGAGLRVERVPDRFAPPDAVGDPTELVGTRLLVDLPAGAAVTRSAVSSSESGGAYRLRRGERAVSVAARLSPAGREAAVGDQVDLFASGVGGSQRTRSLIAGAEVLAVEDGATAGKTQLTLRLATTQVTAVVQADVFARELRAVFAGNG